MEGVCTSNSVDCAGRQRLTRQRLCGMALVALVTAGLAIGAWAQGAALEEVMVTGTRRVGEPVVALPAVTIRKRADFLIQAVEISNDTRDAKSRRDETYQTLRGLVQASARVPGLSLAFQKGVLIPITEKDYQIPLVNEGSRDDTSHVIVYVKLALTPQTDVSQAINTLEAFIRDGKMVGRTALDSQGEVALSVVNPERYRGEVIAAIAQSVKDLRNSLGDRCRINLGDFSRRLQWQRSEVSELTLYLPYELKVEGC
jgi:hypothetical protein